MPFKKLQFIPGIDADATSYSGEGSWRDGDKIRFRAGFPEKIDGWISDSGGHNIDGIPRRLHTWRDLNGAVYIAIGTHSRAYYLKGGDLVDITPIRLQATIVDAFTTISGSNVVTVTHVNHGALTGDRVTIAGARWDTAGWGRETWGSNPWAVALIVEPLPVSELNADHRVTFVSSSTYTITVSSNATRSATGGGSVVSTYDTPAGPVDQTAAYGYGASEWGGSIEKRHWGTAATSSNIVLHPLTWSIFNWGEDLILNPHGGGMYHWDATSPLDRPTLIANAPTRVSYSTVTKDRHILALGCNPPGTSSALDPLQIRWCDQENFNDWSITAFTTAGSMRLESGIEIQGAATVESRTLVWTDTDVHTINFIGAPYTFSIARSAITAGIISPFAWSATDSALYWMGPYAFHSFSGGVRTVPSTLHRFVYSNISDQNRLKTFAAANRVHNEITWFYITKDVEDTFLSLELLTSDRTVQVSTTAGFPTSGTLLVGSENILYESKNDTEFLDCTRGSNNTTALDHSIRTVVAPVGAPAPVEPCRYVTLNTQDGVWTTGRLERTAWEDSVGRANPMACSLQGVIYYHNTGVDADGKPLVSFIESAEFDLDLGDRATFVSRFIPDFNIENGSVDVTIGVRNFPHGQKTDNLLGTITSSTEKLDTRVRGRQASLKLESINLGDDWELGVPRIDVQPDGGR
jgi:hypothetical protein